MLNLIKSIVSRKAFAGFQYLAIWLRKTSGVSKTRAVLLAILSKNCFSNNYYTKTEDMDPNLTKAIRDFKEKQTNSGPALDCVELERCLREFITELYIKRDEVNQLRTELDATNSEMQNLRKALDVTKKALDENQFNLNLQLKKARSNDEELLEKRESLMKIQLQYKMANAEVETLKENLQQTELEKLELSRKVDVFEAKQRHNSVYHNEILKRDNQLRNFMTNINEQVVKLQAEQVQVTELSKKNELAREALEKLKVCEEELKTLTGQKEKFERMYIKANAMYEKLEELMVKDSGIQRPNLLTNIIIDQWKLSTSRYKIQMKQTNEVLDKTMQCLADKNITNGKLINENENIKEVNKRLEEENLKLKEMCKGNSENIRTLNEKIKLLEEGKLAKDNENSVSSKDLGVQIKEEPIEIVD